jgi:proteasome lid subunit RPN8/RPN11
MNFSMTTIIRAFVAPKHRLSCSSRLWCEGMLELRRRGNNRRESGAFLLGTRNGQRRSITRFVFYDDLDPHCLDTGIVVFDGSGYGPLWKLCRETQLGVLADIHTHGGRAIQSLLDRDNPMIAQPGHVALIAPHFAERVCKPIELGIYEYVGEHLWENMSGSAADRYFYIGFWG